MCIPSEPIPPPTEKSEILVNQLRILLYIQLIIGILQFFTAQGWNLGFSNLISCFILYIGYSQLSFCYMIMYICFNGSSFAMIVNAIGTAIQDGLPLFPQGQSFSLFLFYGSCAFYIISFYYAFQAYKEFKALMVEGALGAAGMGGGMGMGGFFGGGGGQRKILSIDLMS
jgi:hypothetical protein